MSKGFRLMMAVGLLVAGLLTVNVGTAQAATISQLLSSPGEYQLRDHSEEVLLRANGQVCTFTDTLAGGACAGVQLAVGDKLVGVINFVGIDSATTSTTIGGASGNSELTAVFSVQVTAITAPCGQAVCVAFVPSTTGIQADLLTVTGGTVNVGAQSAGTMGLFYEDTSPDFSVIGTRSQVFGSAVGDGTLFWVLGQTVGAPTNFWDATASTLLIGNVGSAGGFFNLGESRLAGGTGPVLGLNTCSDTVGPVTGSQLDNFCANGTLAATIHPDSFLASDQTQVAILIPGQVPEPTSVVLLGTGLIGLAFARWRKRN